MVHHNNVYLALHLMYPSPVPFPTGREGDGGWVFWVSFKQVSV